MNQALRPSFDQNPFKMLELEVKIFLQFKAF